MKTFASLNTNKVFHVAPATVCGTRQMADVAHVPASLKCQHLGMRRTRRSMCISSRYADPLHRDARRLGHERSEAGQSMRPALWARLVLSRVARG
jgi:hypothetical protein